MAVVNYLRNLFKNFSSKLLKLYIFGFVSFIELINKVIIFRKFFLYCFFKFVIGIIEILWDKTPCSLSVCHRPLKS